MELQVTLKLHGNLPNRVSKDITSLSFSKSYLSCRLWQILLCEDFANAKFSFSKWYFTLLCKMPLYTLWNIAYWRLYLNNISCSLLSQLLVSQAVTFSGKRTLTYVWSWKGTKSCILNKLVINVTESKAGSLVVICSMNGMPFESRSTRWKRSLTPWQQ